MGLAYRISVVEIYFGVVQSNGRTGVRLWFAGYAIGIEGTEPIWVGKMCKMDLDILYISLSFALKENQFDTQKRTTA